MPTGADRDRVIRSGQKHADRVRGLALDVLQQTADLGQVEEDLNRELEVLMAGRFTLQVEQRESDEQAEEKTPRVLLVGTALVCLAVLITVAVLDHRGWHVPGATAVVAPAGPIGTVTLLLSVLGPGPGLELLAGISSRVLRSGSDPQGPSKE